MHGEQNALVVGPAVDGAAVQRVANQGQPIIPIRPVGAGEMDQHLQTACRIEAEQSAAAGLRTIEYIVRALGQAPVGSLAVQRARRIGNHAPIRLAAIRPISKTIKRLERAGPRGNAGCHHQSGCGAHRESDANAHHVIAREPWIKTH
jgi:hypothetical protein